MDLLVDKNNNNNNNNNTSTNSDVNSNNNLINSNITNNPSEVRATGESTTLIDSTVGKISEMDSNSNGLFGTSDNANDTIIINNNNNNNNTSSLSQQSPVKNCNTTNETNSSVLPSSTNLTLVNGKVGRRTGQSVRIKLEPTEYRENMQKVPSMSDLLEESSLGKSFSPSTRTPLLVNEADRILFN